MTTHFCLRCSADHPMHYTKSTTQNHLVVECPKGMYPIKFVQGLDIPWRESKAFLKAQARAKQAQLL